MKTSNKILPLSDLLKQVTLWKEEHLKVVFTNGCFDIIHLGHIDYLEKARNLGDKMIVALNTDASVSKLKGPERPIVNQEARGRMMASFAFVDAVVLFDEDTPLDLIKAIKPDILVKGSDYLTENIVGAEIVISNGGSVETIDLVEGYSTTKIIDKIKQLK